MSEAYSEGGSGERNLEEVFRRFLRSGSRYRARFPTPFGSTGYVIDWSGRGRIVLMNTAEEESAVHYDPASARRPERLIAAQEVFADMLSGQLESYQQTVAESLAQEVELERIEREHPVVFQLASGVLRASNRLRELVRPLRREQLHELILRTRWWRGYTEMSAAARLGADFLTYSSGATPPERHLTLAHKISDLYRELGRTAKRDHDLQERLFQRRWGRSALANT